MIISKRRAEQLVRNNEARYITAVWSNGYNQSASPDYVALDLMADGTTAHCEFDPSCRRHRVMVQS